MSICYIINKNSSFAEKDFKILSCYFKVIKVNFRYKNKITFLISLPKIVFELISCICKSKLILIQHAGYHSFISLCINKVFKRKTLVILGGSDCFSYCEFQYGNYCKSLMSIATKLSVQWADKLIFKSESMYSFFDTYNYEPGKIKGLVNHIKVINKPLSIIPNGYDYINIGSSNFTKNDVFITVASNLDLNSNIYKLKGIDLIIDIASSFPEFTFIIVGLKKGQITKSFSSNITFYPELENDKVIELLLACKYYLQLSRSEGFPNALCEAMLCGCIPIVSNVSSMPEIINENGVVLLKPNKHALKIAINKAIQLPSSFAFKNREQIRINYPLINRENKLLKLINNYY